MKKPKYIDLTGKTFGNYTVIDINYDKKVKNVRGKFWNCVCSCGTQRIIQGTLLHTGKTKSCGCIKATKRKDEVHNWKGYEELYGTYWYSIKEGAERRSLEFSITIVDAWNKFILQDRKCALSNLEITIPKKHSDLIDNPASLDRIDSSKGYTIDNIQWVHKDVNKMKMDFNESHFIEMCKLISQTANKKESSCNNGEHATDNE